MSQFMVIETFRRDCKEAVYDRFDMHGRMLPNGLVYLNSWPEKDGNRCFQLMETEDPSLFDLWIANWSDLVDFEVVKLSPRLNKDADLSDD